MFLMRTLGKIGCMSNWAYSINKVIIIIIITSEKQGRSSNIQDKSGKHLTEEQAFSAGGQNIAQNCTTMKVGRRVVETTQY